MYLDCKVGIPNVVGKISRFRKGKATYIRFEVGRKYLPDKKSYLRNGALRVQSDGTANAKNFAEFVALIVRCRIVYAS